MPPWFPRSTFGFILAALYVIVAVVVVVSERGASGGGGWISLKGMGSYLITIPVSLLGEKLGMRPDYRRNLDMAFAIGVCAMLVYLLGAGIEKLARMIFSSGNGA